MNNRRETPNIHRDFNQIVIGKETDKSGRKTLWCGCGKIKNFRKDVNKPELYSRGN